MKKVISILTGVFYLNVIFVSSLPILPANAECFKQKNMPDFGQHSNKWCWVAAAANTLWWFGKRGYFALEDLEDIDPESKNSSSSWYCWCGNGYHKLLKHICSSTWHDDDGDGIRESGESGYEFYQAVETNHDYICGLRAALAGRSTLEVTEDWGATFDDYKKALEKGEGVILWVENYNGFNKHHYVTGASYNDMKINVSDPWTPDKPDHNNDPTLKDYDTWDVISQEYFDVDIPGKGVKSIGKIIRISRQTNGDTTIPVNELELLALYITLTIAIVSIVAVTIFFIKHKKKQ